MPRPPKPEPRICECGEPGFISRRGKAYPGSPWCRNRRCTSCHSLWYNHKLTRAEYVAYLNQGCAVEGCLAPAKAIDHDHSICPQGFHSCDKCRRGPLCHRHNSTVIAILDALRAGKLGPELAYLGWDAA